MLRPFDQQPRQSRLSVGFCASEASCHTPINFRDGGTGPPPRFIETSDWSWKHSDRVWLRNKNLRARASAIRDVLVNPCRIHKRVAGELDFTE